MTVREQIAQLNEFVSTRGANSFYGFVLKYSQEMNGSPLPRDVKYGKEGECYANSTHLIIGKDGERYTYYEGFAMRNDLPIAVQHAWCVRDGQVIDRTWRKAENATYFGVPFAKEFVCRHIIEAGYYGILGNQWLVEGAPLFTRTPVLDDDGNVCDYGEELVSQ